MVPLRLRYMMVPRIVVVYCRRYLLVPMATESVVELSNWAMVKQELSDRYIVLNAVRCHLFLCVGVSDPVRNEWRCIQYASFTLSLSIQSYVIVDLNGANDSHDTRHELPQLCHETRLIRHAKLDLLIG